MPTVVLLHGLYRTRWSMRRLERRLRAVGFSTLNLGYPWSRYGFDGLAAWLEGELARRAPGTSVFHFVTHSAGGILVRALAARASAPPIGRVVMLAPPNHGSEVADRIASRAALRWALPRLGRELTTGPDGIAHRLGPPPFALGVIAGTRSLNPLFSAWLPHADDGAVTVASTRLEGMADFATVRYGHTFMMDRPEVADRVARFLREGCFSGERRGPARAEGLDTGRA